MGPDPGAAPGRSGNAPSGTLPWEMRPFRKFPKATASCVHPPSCRPAVRAGDLHNLRMKPCRLCQAQGGAGPVRKCCFLAIFQGCSSTCSLVCPALHRVPVSGRCSPGTPSQQPGPSPEQKPAGQSLCKACQPDRLCRDKRSDGTQTGHSLSRGRLPGGLGLRAFCLAALPAPPCRGPCALSRRQSL